MSATVQGDVHYRGMPRFYFDVRDGEKFVSDDDGLEFPGIREAKRDAMI